MPYESLPVGRGCQVGVVTVVRKTVFLSYRLSIRWDGPVISILKVFGGLIICGVGGVVVGQVPEGDFMVLYSLVKRCWSCGIVCVAHLSHSCGGAEGAGGRGGYRADVHCCLREGA